MEKIRLSIIIVNWNTKDLVRECLQSIETHLAKNINYEIVVVDNDSSDGSAAAIESEFPAVRLIKNDANVGFVKANNQAYKLVSGEYVLVLNPDTLILDGDIKKILSYMDKHGDIGIAAGKMLNSDKTFQSSYRKFPTFVGTISNNTFRLVSGISTPFQKRHRLYNLDPDVQHDVDWVVGAYMVVRKNILKKQEIFDSDLFMYFEDTLLCYRARESGYRVTYLPIAPIIHHHGQSAKQIKAQSTFYSFQGSIQYIRKVYGQFSANIYIFVVTNIWRVGYLTFTILGLIPYEKFKNKKILFKTLLSKLN